MTNLEKYNKILKRNLQATDEDLNDDVLVYNRFKRWESVRHVDMVAEACGVFFETLDITSFSTYSKGIEILEKLGVDMSK